MTPPSYGNGRGLKFDTSTPRPVKKETCGVPCDAIVLCLVVIALGLTHDWLWWATSAAVAIILIAAVIRVLTRQKV